LGLQLACLLLLWLWVGYLCGLCQKWAFFKGPPHAPIGPRPCVYTGSGVRGAVARGAAAAPGRRCPAAAGSGGSPGIMPGPPDAAECALSAQVVARRRRSTARTAAAAPSCSAAWQLLHGMLGRAKLLGMVQGSSSSAAAVPEMRFVLSMSHAPHGCRMWSLTGYIRQLFACLGGRIAGDPLRKDEVCT
jgi:hypothetical protein